MKSPLFALVCCLLALAAAAIPLGRFILPADSPPDDARSSSFSSTLSTQAGNAPLPSTASEVSTSASQQVEAPALVRYTGEPLEITLSLAGRELARFSPEAPGSRQIKLLLPPLSAGSSVELEVRAVWSGTSGSAHVITVELSPPSLPSVADTHWANPGESEIHEIYYFHWPECPSVRGNF